MTIAYAVAYKQSSAMHAHGVEQRAVDGVLEISDGSPRILHLKLPFYDSFILQRISGMIHSSASFPT